MKIEGHVFHAKEIALCEGPTEGEKLEIFKRLKSDVA